MIPNLKPFFLLFSDIYIVCRQQKWERLAIKTNPNLEETIYYLFSGEEVDRVVNIKKPEPHLGLRLDNNYFYSFKYYLLRLSIYSFDAFMSDNLSSYRSCVLVGSFKFASKANSACFTANSYSPFEA